MGLEKFRKDKPKDDDDHYVNVDIICNDTNNYKRKKYNINTMEVGLLDEEFIASRIMRRD